MTVAIIAIIAGLVALTWSADRFVSGAAAAAKSWGVSPMLIGLTVVSIGTSAPEILVSITAALQGHGDIAVGNAIGSNIANIGLVLGVTALIAPLPIKFSLSRREIPWLVLVTLVAGGCIVNGYLGVVDALVLLFMQGLTLYLMFRWQKKADNNEYSEGDELPDLAKSTAWLYLLGGLALLLASSQLLVWGAVRVAEMMGVSELVIGLTIVAIGTSLPELAASLVSALRGHHDIALGNVAGSNIFNLLAVLSVPAMIAPGELNDAVIWRDYPVMLGLTVFVALLAMLGKQPRHIGRLASVILLASYCFYGVWLYIHHL
ncbi:calcium/sodium antiporter [Candidatus Sororendozoicomonas aggregata]|uniref:calcium/sodium antiporter n=1 Tax=Candidatus Sororendozoicomonas aggregata TaxID=3073239 RepID=UPI002ECFB5B6